MKKEIGIPINSGPFNPFQVLWSPKILLPSRKFLPPSIGLPPPVNTIEAFDIYAGTIINRLNINIEIQSAHVKIRDIITKSSKIKKIKTTANISAIFFCFISKSVKLLLTGNLLYSLKIGIVFLKNMIIRLIHN